MASSTSLFDSYQLGAITLSNRIVMAPMTRSRAGEGDVPTALHVEYYKQRASAGLIITEGTQPSRHGKGYCRTPGIHTAMQTFAWKKVTDAVHAEGGKIFLQIMHCGRVAHHANKDEDAETVAPSVVTAKGDMFTEQGMLPFDEPRELALHEIPAVIEEYYHATDNALAAGFDGVELHCTSGYLPMQFLSTGTNKRNDPYGGNLLNRMRFAVEVLEAMSSVRGPECIGLRICPGNPFNDCYDDDPVETYRNLLMHINPHGLAYVHVIQSPLPELNAYELARECFLGPLILNESLDFAKGTELVQQDAGDLVSYARHYIGNPDLVERFKTGASLNEFDAKTLYTPGEKGYTDYPFLEEQTAGELG
ncbi:MAG: alkene reductase [Pseudomonadales bacterium]